MAKIILEFNGEDEAIDARTALDGWKWKSAMWDLDQILRSTVKHGISIIEKDNECLKDQRFSAPILFKQNTFCQ